MFALTPGQAGDMFSGGQCELGAFINGAGADVPVHVILGAPITGAMNTADFDVFQANGGASQETAGIIATPSFEGGTTNPLNHLPCTDGGDRSRAIGSDEVISVVQNNPDTVGYALFSYADFAQLAQNPNFRYLTLDGVDPFSTQRFAQGSSQELPACAAVAVPPPGEFVAPGPCPAPTLNAAFTNFFNLRNGTYKAWAMLRIVTDDPSVNQANFNNAKNLVTLAQLIVDSTVPDYVPFTTLNRSDGLGVYREHYMQSGIAPNDGTVSPVSPINGTPKRNTLGLTGESGGDMGGCIKGPFPVNGHLAVAPGPVSSAFNVCN